MSIRPIDKTLSGATTPGQSGPGNDGNERVHCIPQSTSITGASLSDYLMPYRLVGRGWGVMQLVYSIAPTNWAKVGVGNIGMTNAKFGEHHFSISSIICQLLTYGIFYTVELVLYLIIPRFLPFLEYEVFLMIGFRSVYGILLDLSARSAFLQLCLPYHFHVYQCDLVSRWEWCYYFWKECSVCQGVLWWEELMYFCSVELGWVSLHINLCMLFNAKSIFIQIISSISNNSV